MNKNSINKICRRFGFEVHGTGFIQSIKKVSFKEDAYQKQSEILMGKARIVFDIGANYGDTVLKYNQLFHDASIYAFEPYDLTYKSLVQKVQHIQNVITAPLAISDQHGSLVFYVNRNVNTNSLLPSQKMGLTSDHEVQQRSTVNVNSTTIDKFSDENNITQIDILKLDIQGGELAALKGASKLLQQKKIKLIYAESYFKSQYVNQPLFFEIGQYLHQFGYYLQDIYNPIYGKGSIAWCDVIFLPQP